MPGAKGGYVLISDAKKRAMPDGLPFPGAIRGGASPDSEPEAAALLERYLKIRPSTQALVMLAQIRIQQGQVGEAAAHLDAAALLARTIVALCLGQAAEMDDLHDLDRSLDAYHRSIVGKTSALFAEK